MLQDVRCNDDYDKDDDDGNDNNILTFKYFIWFYIIYACWYTN